MLGKRPDGKFYNQSESAASKADRIDTYLKRIERLPDDGINRLQVTIPSELHQALRIEAATQDVTLKAHVTEILMRALGQGKVQNHPQPVEKKVLTVDLPAQVFKALKTNAINEEISLSTLIIKALEKG